MILSIKTEVQTLAQEVDIPAEVAEVDRIQVEEVEVQDNFYNHENRQINHISGGPTNRPCCARPSFVLSIYR